MACKPLSVEDDHLSGLPVARQAQAAHPALSAVRVTPMRLLGLAPGRVCLAADIPADAGGLLHRRFTLALACAKAIRISVALCRRVTPPGR